MNVAIKFCLFFKSCNAFFERLDFALCIGLLFALHLYDLNRSVVDKTFISQFAQYRTQKSLLIFQFIFQFLYLGFHIDAVS